MDANVTVQEMVNETADMMNGKLKIATEEVKIVRENMQVL